MDLPGFAKKACLFRAFITWNAVVRLFSKANKK